MCACVGTNARRLRKSSFDIYVAEELVGGVLNYNNAGAYKTTIGVTGVLGDDQMHYREPSGVLADASGTIYVGDSGNSRVQKCTYSVGSDNCATFAGDPAASDDAFGHFSGVSAIAVAGSVRVFSADVWHHRVQVFDASGAFVTTIGGNGGSRSSEYFYVGG
jgi:NHL repeat